MRMWRKQRSNKRFGILIHQLLEDDTIRKKKPTKRLKELEREMNRSIILTTSMVRITIPVMIRGNRSIMITTIIRIGGVK